MATPKYSMIEFERRWLLPSTFTSMLQESSYKKIEDLYLSCGQLRLRAITDSQTGKLEFKFCKKYGSISTGAEPIVNIYLSIEEYGVLSTLPGHKIKKKRYKHVVSSTVYSIDVFEGDLSGLILCEVEAASEVMLNQIPNPSIAIKEVTGDPKFCGGGLCLLNRDEVAYLLSK